MSIVQWAKTVRCDWPGCQSIGEASQPVDGISSVLPTGWLSFRAYIVRYDGHTALGEICSIHAGATLADAHKLLVREGS